MGMARKPRILQTEYPYHLVCRTNNRTFRFMKKRFTRIFFATLVETIKKYDLLVHHVVLMSNHYHIVATATNRNLHRAMQYLNSRVAVKFNRAAGRTGHLWGDRYKSCIIDTDEHYLVCVRYVYRNPLRAGMVENLYDFEDSSFGFWAFDKKVEMALSNDHLVVLWGQDKDRIHQYYRILVSDSDVRIPDDEVKKSLRGLFFGSADFKKRMCKQHLPH